MHAQKRSPEIVSRDLQGNADAKSKYKYSEVAFESSTIKYISLPSSILKNQSLTQIAKAVYGALRYYQLDKGKCYPKAETIAKLLGCGQRSVNTALRQLRNAGLVTSQRRFKNSNIYHVKIVRDAEYLRIPSNILSIIGLTMIEKLLIASLMYKENGQDDQKRQSWAFQNTLANELGASRWSIIRALERLEKAKNIDVKHRGGGRSRGNIYRMHDQFNCAILLHGSEINCSKTAQQKINNHKELKRTYPKRENFSLKGLSQEKTGQETAYELLTRHGINKKVAESIVFEQKHTPESIENAVTNAKARQAIHKIADKDELKPFKLAAYIIGTLNTARREAHEVGQAKAVAEIRRRVDAIRNPKILDANAFEARRRAMIAQLDAISEQEGRVKNVG